MKKKTYKGWQKSNVDLGIYLGAAPCEIDEELYLYIAECVPAQYCDNRHMQGGDCEFIEHDTEYYMTGAMVGECYYYLGILPEFKQ